jgi:Putative adhesin
MPTFDTPEPITASIDVVSGDVRVIASDRADTVVDVQPTDPANRDDVRAAERTRVHCAGGLLIVKAPKLRSWAPRSDGGSIDVTIELPAGSGVHGAGQLADFRCEGPIGECRIKTGLGFVQLDEVGTLSLKSGTGDVSVDRVTGDADVMTGSGDVRVRELASSAVIKNSNGDTWVGTANRDLRVNAANGSIAIDLANADVSAKSANGDVRLGEAVRGSVALETKLGDVEVGIREGTSAWLDVSASAGKVHNALEAAEGPEPAGETVEVRARTTVGAIVVRRPS